MVELSIVITVLNEENNVGPLSGQLHEALKNYTYEVIWVDDGSNDQTARNIRNQADDHTKLIVLTKNFGQTAAMSAGIDQAQGEYIITLDGDLQNNPADIPRMLEKLKREDWDVVTGFRKNRKDGFFLRKIPSRIANRLIQSITGVSVRDYGCTLKVFKSVYAKNLGLYGELHRFIPILLALQGARIMDVEVSHFPRIHGKSKYGIGRTFKVMSDLLLMLFLQKYFRRPIHLFGPIGIITFMAGSVISLYLLVVKLMGQDIWGRPLLLLGISLILAGIQFLTFGLLAELMMRIYYESQNKKTYSVKELFLGKKEVE